MSKLPLLDDPWYKEGLSFKCTQCGKCCTGSPGYVWLNEEDIQKIASHLHLSTSEFIKRYTRQVQGRLALLEHPKNYDCVFLKDRLCQIYSARPKQCTTFPWWKDNLSSKDSWEAAARRCEGISHPEAPTISLEEIEKMLDDTFYP